MTRKTVSMAMGLLLGLLCGPQPELLAAEVPKTPSLTIKVQASPEAEFRTELKIESKPLMTAVQSLQADVPGPPPVSDTYVSLEENGSARDFLVAESGDWFAVQEGRNYRIPEAAKAKLKPYLEAARGAHYGKLVPWEEAAGTIKMKSICMVTDLETGQSFEVQRRAGKLHADMQPLTREDTEIMKGIYEGRWSWRRRAVLVHKDGAVLAGSMHGMPHGGDGIPDNGFSGHFCIHFLGSSTHGSKSVDPDHQWMVYKAAGKLDEALRKAAPAEVANLFLVALNQQDPMLLRRAFADPGNPQLGHYLQRMDGIKSIRTPEKGREGGGATKEDDPALLSVEVPMEVTLHTEGQKPERQALTFRLKRNGPEQPWKIESVSLIS